MARTHSRDGLETDRLDRYGLAMARVALARRCSRMTMQQFSTGIEATDGRGAMANRAFSCPATHGPTWQRNMRAGLEGVHRNNTLKRQPSRVAVATEAIIRDTGVNHGRARESGEIACRVAGLALGAVSD